MEQQPHNLTCNMMYQVYAERRTLHFCVVEPIRVKPCFLSPSRCSVPPATLHNSVCMCLVAKAVNRLAEELRLQVQPLQDVLGHAQDRINWLDLLVAKQGESCHSKQSVERIHLQNERTRSTGSTAPLITSTMVHHHYGIITR